MSNTIPQDGITTTAVESDAGSVDYVDDETTASESAAGVSGQQAIEDSTEFIDETIATWQAGGTVSDEDMDTFIDLAVALSPDEIQSMADDGEISQTEANALIMVRGFVLALPPNTPTEVIQNGMNNFYCLDDTNQSLVVEWMGGLTHASNQSDSTATPEQKTVTIYLCGHRAGNVDAETLDSWIGWTQTLEIYAPAAHTWIQGQVDAFKEMSPEEQQEVLDTYKALAEPHLTAALKERLETAIPEFLKQLLSAKYNALDVAKQVFLICGTNTLMLTVQMKYLYAKEQQGVDAYYDAQMAQYALDDAVSDSTDGTVDLDTITFTDHNGCEVNLVDWCNEMGIDLPEDDDGVDGTYVVSADEAGDLSNDIYYWGQNKQADNEEINNELTRDNQLLQLYATLWKSTSKTIYECEKQSVNDMNIFD